MTQYKTNEFASKCLLMKPVYLESLHTTQKTILYFIHLFVKNFRKLYANYVRNIIYHFKLIRNQLIILRVDP